MPLLVTVVANAAPPNSTYSAPPLETAVALAKLPEMCCVAPVCSVVPLTMPP